MLFLNGLKTKETIPTISHLNFQIRLQEISSVGNFSISTNAFRSGGRDNYWKNVIWMLAAFEDLCWDRAVSPREHSSGKSINTNRKRRVLNASCPSYLTNMHFYSRTLTSLRFSKRIQFADTLIWHGERLRELVELAINSPAPPSPSLFCNLSICIGGISRRNSNSTNWIVRLELSSNDPC